MELYVGYDDFSLVPSVGVSTWGLIKLIKLTYFFGISKYFKISYKYVLFIQS
jgi:hypothetical protein